METIKRAWIWLVDDHVILADPHTERWFARCTACGRVFMHYWACVTAADRAKGRQVGCKCGNLRFRITQDLPVWMQAWFVLSRYLWRKVIKKERYWDPRMAAKKG